MYLLLYNRCPLYYCLWFLCCYCADWLKASSCILIWNFMYKTGSPSPEGILKESCCTPTLPSWLAIQRSPRAQRVLQTKRYWLEWDQTGTTRNRVWNRTGTISSPRLQNFLQMRHCCCCFRDPPGRIRRPKQPLVASWVAGCHRHWVCKPPPPSGPWWQPGSACWNLGERLQPLVWSPNDHGVGPRTRSCDPRWGTVRCAARSLRQWTRQSLAFRFETTLYVVPSFLRWFPWNDCFRGGNCRALFAHRERHSVRGTRLPRWDWQAGWWGYRQRASREAAASWTIGCGSWS